MTTKSDRTPSDMLAAHEDTIKRMDERLQSHGRMIDNMSTRIDDLRDVKIRLKTKGVLRLAVVLGVLGALAVRYALGLDGVGGGGEWTHLEAVALSAVGGLVSAVAGGVVTNIFVGDW